MKPTLAIDLGGTRMRAARVDATGQILAHKVVPTPRGDPEPGALLGLMREIGVGVASAVVGVPGRVDHRVGGLDHAPNLPPTWAPFLTERALGAVLGVPVHLANDADLAAVGEAYFGAGAAYDDTVYVTLSTGVGAGVLLGRRLVRGRRSLAEVGHCVLDLSAAARGLPSTFEQLASGTSVARTAAWMGTPGDAARIVRLAAAGDALAQRVLDTAIQAACVGVRNLAFTFSPEVIILGGGFGLVGEVLWGPIRATLATHGPPGLPTPIVVTGAALGDAAGLVGAAAWRAATAERGAQ